MNIDKGPNGQGTALKPGLKPKDGYSQVEATAKEDFTGSGFHERSVVAQLLTRLSFGFSLGVGVLTNIFIPYPKREAKRESHSYENLTWLLVRGGGIKKKYFILSPKREANRESC